MRQYVPEEQLWTEFNGTLGFDYDHSTYWPALTALCAERRVARKERWLAGGSQVGEHEDYLTGHEAGVNKTAPSAAEEPKAADEVTLVAEAAPQATTTADEALAAKTGELAISENAPAATDAEENPALPVVASA